MIITYMYNEGFVLQNTVGRFPVKFHLGTGSLLKQGSSKLTDEPFISTKKYAVGCKNISSHSQ